MEKKLITITINEKTHQFKAGDVEAMRGLPWSDRKQLIELLENIKQAEFVKVNNTQQSAAIDDPITASQQSNPIDAKALAQIEFSKQTKSINSQGSIQATNKPQLDPGIKASEKDVDDVMARLILEQKQQQKPIPDKSSVIKVMLLVFAVIIGLMLIF